MLSSTVILIAARKYPITRYADHKILKLIKYRLSAHTVPHHYNIKLEINPLELSVIGRSVITLHIRTSTKLISLHFEGIIIQLYLKNNFDFHETFESKHSNKTTGATDIYFKTWLSPGIYDFDITHLSYPPRDRCMLKHPTCLEDDCL